MPQVEIVSEEGDGPGWRFAAQVLDDHGTLRRHDVTLSWADYNLWSASGRDTPAHVAASVVTFLAIRRGAENLKPTFDASLARRLEPDADEVIGGMG